MKIITKIIKPVSTPNISKTLDVQTNDGHIFIKHTKTTSIPLMIHIKHTSITLISNKNNNKPLIHIKYTL